MRSLFRPTAKPVNIVTGQRPAPSDSLVERFAAGAAIPREVGAETSRTSRPSRSPASNAASYNPTGKIAELLGGDVRGSEVLRPATINRISSQPIPVDAP